MLLFWLLLVSRNRYAISCRHGACYLWYQLSGSVHAFSHHQQLVYPTCIEEESHGGSLAIVVKQDTFPLFLYLIAVPLLIAWSPSASQSRADSVRGRMRILHWRTFAVRTKTEDDGRKLPLE